MNYPNIKAAKLSHKEIAKAFGYKNVNSFRCSSAHKSMMEGIETILGIIILKNAIKPTIDEIIDFASGMGIEFTD